MISKESLKKVTPTHDKPSFVDLKIIQHMSDPRHPTFVRLSYIELHAIPHCYLVIQHMAYSCVLCYKSSNDADSLMHAALKEGGAGVAQAGGRD